MAAFLSDYRNDASQLIRLERVLAFGRAFFAVSSLIAIYLDPTEPTRFATLTYTLLVIYVIHSVAVLAFVRRAGAPTTRLGRILHGGDIVFASAITFFSEGPVSPFFLFFLFTVVASAYRWGFRETIGTALVTAAIFLAETWVAMFGPWHETVFADITFNGTDTILRVAYLLLTGALLGYLAEQEKQIRAESTAIAAVMKAPGVGKGLSVSLVATTRLLMHIFEARGVDLVFQELESGRTLHWRIGGGDPTEVERIELNDAEADMWLAPSGARVFHGERSGEGTCSAVGLIDSTTWWPAARSIRLPADFAIRRQWQTVTAIDLSLDSEWRGRIMLVDAAHLTRSRGRLYFVSSLADHLTPVISSLFLLRRLRSRASAAERAKVARELHDGAIQSMIGIEMETEAARRRAELMAPAIEPDLIHIRDLMRDEVVALRELMQQLRPVDLDQPRYLPELLMGMTERFRRDTSIVAKFASDADTSKMPLRIAVEIARMTQEALINVRKHSRASNVMVQLSNAGNGWMLSVDDDGQGFNFEGRLTGDDLKSRWTGPTMLLERARLVGGQIVIDSKPGVGARIEVVVHDHVAA